MEENIVLEKEMDCPENWDGDVVLIRDGKGNIIELEVPDDIEEDE